MALCCAEVASLLKTHPPKAQLPNLQELSVLEELVSVVGRSIFIPGELPPPLLLLGGREL